MASSSPIVSLFKDGEKLREVSIETESILGRDKSCDIRIDDQLISRKHIILRPGTDSLEMEKQSRYGVVTVNGKAVDRASLQEGDEVLIGPYQLKIVYPEKASPAEVPIAASTVESMLEQEAPIEEFNLDSEGAGDFDLSLEQSKEEEIPDDATDVLSQPNVSVRLVIPEGMAEKVEYEFDQSEISIGRSPDCDIVISDKKSSRKNTVIRRAGMSFVVKDMESSNGTYLNGTKIQQETLSGDDLIQIGDTPIQFTVISKDYESQADQFMSVKTEDHLENFQDINPPMEAPTMDSVIPASDSAGFDGVPGFDTENKQKSLLEKFREMPPRKQAIYGATLLMLIWTLLEEEEPTRTPAKAPIKTQQTKKVGQSFKPSFAQLSPKQQEFVRSQHALAFEYYKSKDFDKALFEVRKIFQLVDNYKDSREIERYSEEGKRRLDALEEEKRKRENEEKIAAEVAGLVETARVFMRDKEYEKASELFPKIISLDPENKTVAKWQKEIEYFYQNKKLAEEEKRVQDAIDQRGWDIYKNGTALLEGEKFHEAISVFQKIKDIGATDENLLSKAKDGVNRSLAEISDRVTPVLEEAKSLESSESFAEAYKKYEKASKLDPKNKMAMDGMKRVEANLHSRAKVLYTEGLIAESYSDYELAVKKFNEIVEVIPKEDDYFGKAKRKLSRYSRLRGLSSFEE